MINHQQIKVNDPHNKEEYEVDKKIVPLLERLWDVGMHTWQSCAGHLSEDRKSYEVPYIGFDFHKTYAPLSGSIFGIMKDRKGYDVGLYWIDKNNELIREDENMGCEVCIVYAKVEENPDGTINDSFSEFEKDLLEICDIHMPDILASRARYSRKDW